MLKIADWMAKAIENRYDDEYLQRIREEVREFALKYPLPSDKE